MTASQDAAGHYSGLWEWVWIALHQDTPYTRGEDRLMDTVADPKKAKGIGEEELLIRVREIRDGLREEKKCGSMI